jgi:replication-associated recombination protein RarA
MQLTEKYRPQKWADVAGQDKALSKCQLLIKRGLGGRAIWISGQSGTGKTTIARLLAAEIAGPDYITEWDASALTVAELQAFEHEMSYRALSFDGDGKPG